MATIKLYKSVPWSQGGFHVLRFNDSLRQAQYFAGLDSEVFEIDWEPRPGANLNVPISYLEAKQFNYLSYNFDNISTHDRYFFIEDYEYLNDNPTTRLIVSEDIWQNNHIDMTVAPGIVHRRHMPRWNGNTPLLYPIDEGNVRSKTVYAKQRIDDYQLLSPMAGLFTYLIATSKDSSNNDEIEFYLTASYKSGQNVPSPNEYFWLSPLSEKFIKVMSTMGFPPSSIIGVWLIPVMRGYANWTGTSLDIPSLVVSDDTTKTKIALLRPAFWNQPVTVSIEPYMPIKSTGTANANIEYEPQAFSENIVNYFVTDTFGNPLITIPNNIMWEDPQIIMNSEADSLNPQIRISVTANGSPVVGLETVVPCVPVAVPQSQWLDYVVTSQQQDKAILENNISNRYITTAISTVTGVGSGYAFGAMYADSFNNSRRSPGMAGLAGAGMNAISGIGSLANAYVQSGTDRDNFRLNEQKTKNTPTPPLAGYNIASVMAEGIQVVTTIGDDISRNLIWKQYRYYGVIVDESMDIPLRTRRYYDYLQTRDATVIGPMTNEAKSYLEALLNRGVTIWHADSATIYDYQYDNVEW